LRDEIVRFLKDNWLGLLIVIALPLAWSGLRSKATPFATLEDFDRLLVSGKPTVATFFSNG